MRESFQVARNTLIQSVGRVLSLAISIVIIGFITRWLGAEQFGYFTTITAYLFFFMVFAELGLYVLVSRELPLVSDQSTYLSGVLSLKVVMSAILLLLAMVVIFLTPYPLAIKIGVVLSVFGYWGNSFISLFTSLFQYKLSTTPLAIGDVLNKIIILLILLGVWLGGWKLYGVVVAFSLGLIGQSWYLFTNVKKTLSVSFQWNPVLWKQILQRTWPYAFSGVLILFYFKADTLILSWYQPQSAVGIYGASYRLLEVLITFPGLFTGLLLPLLSKSYEEGNQKRFQAIWQRSFDGLVFVVTPIVFFTLGAAEEILFYLTGTEFVVGANALRLLILATGFIFLAHLTTFSVGALNIQKKMVPHFGIAAALALFFYFLLIPHYSYYGAAFTTVLVEAYIFLASFFLVRSNYRFSFSWRRVFMNILNGFLAFLVLLIFKPISIFLSAPIFGILYILLGFATKTIDRSVVAEFIGSGLNRFKKPVRPSFDRH